MTSTVDVSVHTSLPWTKVDIQLKHSNGEDPTYWLSIDSCNIFVNAESAGRIVEALRPLVPASFGIEPEPEEPKEPHLFDDDEIPF